MTYRRSQNEIPVMRWRSKKPSSKAVKSCTWSRRRAVSLGRMATSPGIEFAHNELGAPDASGRRRPQPIAGSEFIIECDQVIVAIGQYQDNSFFPKDFFPELDRRGNPELDQTGHTAHPKVWACGDYVSIR